MTSSTTRTLATLFLPLLLAACATTTPMQAITDHDSRYDFTGRKKIAIQPVSRTDPATVSISDKQVSMINEALSAQLRSQGFLLVPDNSQADLFLSWHLVTREKTDVKTYNSVSTYNCWRCGPPVTDVTAFQYTQGTFIVDVIDPQRLQSVWRATIQSRLESQPDPVESEQRRREAAQAVFADFPPAGAPANMD